MNTDGLLQNRQVFCLKCWDIFVSQDSKKTFFFGAE